MYNQYNRVKMLTAVPVSMQHNRFFVYRKNTADSIPPKKTEKVHLILAFAIIISFSFSDKFSSFFSSSVIDGMFRIISMVITKLPTIIVNSAKIVKKDTALRTVLLIMFVVVKRRFFVIIFTSFSILKLYNCLA